ncbi:MAG TPA: glycosyl hydrolase family 8 [Acidobacteriaceae bacterium]|jgi:oligosaccharide reducing-end xylanase
MLLPRLFRSCRPWIMIVPLLCALVSGAKGHAQKLDDGSGAFHTRHYRDLFAERGHTPAETRARIDKAFAQLFHGDKENESVYFESGSNSNGPLAYITDWANKDARTEGMSYGMMIAMQLNKKHEFDAIWNWANTYMLITDAKNPNHGYFAWSMNVDGTPRSDSPAPDGEEYFVMALYFADHRWGSGKGIYNYKAEANRILRLMRHHPVETSTGPFRLHPDDPPFVPKPRPFRPLPSLPPSTAAANSAVPVRPPSAVARNMPRMMGSGPMMEEKYAMIRFVPNFVPAAPGAPPNPFGNAAETTDASYHLPHFYELWARWGPVEDRAFWAHAAEVSRKFFPAVTGPDTGLTPDRSNFDTSVILGRDGHPTPYSYDSWRSISNWSVDYAWFHKSADERVLSDRYQKFLVGQGIHTFADRYTLDGKPLSERHSPGMVATGAVGSLAAREGANADAFVDELWNTPVPSGQQRYYDGMLYIMSMLHCSGNYRIW